MTCDGLAGPLHSPQLLRLGQTHRFLPRPSYPGPRSLLLRWQGPQGKGGCLLQLLKTESICLKLGDTLCAEGVEGGGLCPCRHRRRCRPHCLLKGHLRCLLLGGHCLPSSQPQL
jgi:hypothetical protein